MDLKIARTFQGALIILGSSYNIDSDKILTIKKLDISLFLYVR